MLIRTWLTVVFAACSALVIVAPASAASCGTFTSTNKYEGNATFRATASHVSCAKAKKALATFFRKGGTGGGRVRVSGWNCRQVNYYSPGHAAIRCRSKAGSAVATAYWTVETNS